MRGVPAILGGGFVAGELHQAEKLHPGQVWWDKDCCWTSGWKEAEVIWVLLSAETERCWDGEQICWWSAAQFYWSGDGWFGAPVKKLIEPEIRKMYYIGGLEKIKNFATNPNGYFCPIQA